MRKFLGRLVFSLIFLGIMAGAVAAADGSWQATYWDNDELSGDAVASQVESDLSHDWGAFSPFPGIVGTDHFSVRWTRSVNFAEGKYRFSVRADDGVRLWVDDVLLIDDWKEHAAGTVSAETTLSAGDHAIKLEYFEKGGLASVQLWWDDITNPVPDTDTISVGTATITNADVLNLRAGHSISYDVVTQVKRGEAVNVVGFRSPGGTWVQIETADGSVGWVKGYYLVSAVNFSALPVWSEPVVVEETDDDADSDDDKEDETAKLYSDDKPNATVNTGALQMRAGAGLAYPVVGTLSSGAVVKLNGVRNASGTWVQVVRADETVGWVNAAYLLSPYNLDTLAVYARPETESSSAPIAAVSATALNIRYGPSASYHIIARAGKGQQMELTGNRNADASWVQVLLPDSTIGWVNASYITTDYPLADLTVSVPAY